MSNALCELRVGQPPQPVLFDQGAEVGHGGRGKGAVADNEPELDIAALSGRGQVPGRENTDSPAIVLVSAFERPFVRERRSESLRAEVER